MQGVECGKTLFEGARLWAGSVLEGAGEGDRAALLAPGSPEPVVIFPPVSDIKAVKSAVVGLRPAFGHSDLTESIVSALSKVDVQHGLEVHVFSDFQEGSWPEDGAVRLRESLSKLGAALFLNRAATVTTGDCGIVKCAFTPPAIMADSGFAVTAGIHANAQYAGDNVLRLDGGGSELNHTAVELMPGDDNSASMTGTPSSTNTGSGEETCFTGSLSLDKDAYALNDTWYYSLPRIEGLQVMLVNGSGERDSYFLRHALMPGGHGVSLLKPFTLEWDAFLAADSGDCVLAFICNPPPLDAGAVTRIRSILSAGRSVVLMPGELNGLTDGTLRAFPALSSVTAVRRDFTEARRLEVGLRNSRSALGRRLNAMLPPPWGFPARSMLELMPGDEADCVLDVGSRAFAITARQDSGTLWVFAVGANRDWSDWPVTPSFLVTVQELGRLAAGGRARMPGTHIGTPLALDWPQHGTSAEFEITSPGGTVRKVAVTRNSIAEPYMLDGFTVPGIHTLRDGHRYVRAAVNIPSSEGILKYLSVAELTKSMDGVSCAYSTDADTLQRRTGEMRQGSPLWPLLLAVAFVLAMFEVLFANVRSRVAVQPRLLGEILGGGENK